MIEIRHPPARDREPACPETHLQALARSQRHFSLVEALLWEQPQPRQGCHLANVG
jgi:hypothetical protein